jgi:hypothetical protein
MVTQTGNQDFSNLLSWYYTQWGRRFVIVHLSSVVKKYFAISFTSPKLILRELKAVGAIKINHAT